MNQRKTSSNVNAFILEWIGIIVFALFFTFNAFTLKNFLRVNTLWNLVIQASGAILAAFGMTCVVSMGCIDISVGSQMGFAGSLFCLIIDRTGSIPLGLAAAILCSVCFGAFNGFMVGKVGMQPMIMTMTMMYVVRGLAKWITGGWRYYISNAALRNFSFYRIGGVVPQQAVLVALAFLFIYIVLRRTRLGTFIEACGDNRIAARVSGIRIVKVFIITYVICGVFAAMAGITECIYASTADPTNLGLDFEGTCIAAAVIGGTPISGGRANVKGTFFGVLTMQMITMMVNMHNYEVAIANVVKAIVIILAVYIQSIDFGRVVENSRAARLQRRGGVGACTKARTAISACGSASL